MDMGKKKILFASICGIICSGILVCIFLIGGGYFSNRTITEYLINIISQDNPEIQKETDELERLHIIRNWVYKKTMLAGTKEYYDTIFAAWEMEGYYCWEMAEYLAELYMEFGWPSLILDIAFLNDEQTIVDSHAVTLVQYKGKWIIEDPTFNISYANKEGTILDIREVREQIRKGESVEIIHGKEENKLYISSLSNYGGIYDKVSSTEKDDVYFYIIRMDADRFLASRQEVLEPIFAKENLALKSENIYEFCYRLYLPLNIDKNNSEHYVEEEKQRLERDLNIQQK